MKRKASPPTPLRMERGVKTIVCKERKASPPTPLRMERGVKTVSRMEESGKGG